jgi:hypothetical protein
VLSLRVSRDKRGYDHIYLLLETRRKGRTVTRLLYGGRWPSPMKIGQQPLDEAMRKTLEQAYPEVTFDWVALQRTLQQALATPRAPMTPEGRRRSAEARGGGGGRPGAPGPGGGGQGGPGGQGGRPQQGPGRVPPGGRPQMPPRQRPPYAPGFGDQGEQERRSGHHSRDPRTFDDTADLPYRGADVVEPDAENIIDTVDIPIQPYDEPILEEGLDTEARRMGLSDIPSGPEEIEPVEERTFVVSTGDDDTGEHALAMDEPGDFRESGGHPEPAASCAPADDRGGVERATFERPELPGAGFTRDEFPVAAPGAPGAPAATDPNAPPRRRRRRRRGGRRSHGGPNAAPQPGDGPSPENGAEAGGEPDDIASDADDQDDDSDV